MCDHGEILLALVRRPLDQYPRFVHARLEALPALPARRLVVRGKEIETELGVGRPAEIAEVPLLEQGVVADGRSGGLPHRLGRHGRAREIAREDPTDALAGQAPGQTPRLIDALWRKGDLGLLDHPLRVSSRLAVPDQIDRHAASDCSAGDLALVGNHLDGRIVEDTRQDDLIGREVDGLIETQLAAIVVAERAETRRVLDEHPLIAVDAAVYGAAAAQ